MAVEATTIRTRARKPVGVFNFQTIFEEPEVHVRVLLVLLGHAGECDGVVAAGAGGEGAGGDVQLPPDAVDVVAVVEVCDEPVIDYGACEAQLVAAAQTVG